MNNTQILVGVIIVLVIVLMVMNRKAEHLDAPNLSNEAIQNISSVYANTSGQAVFNNIKVTGNADFGNFKGIIVMWSGTNVPSGWTLCDGTNGTPDLRGRFVLGSGKGENLTERKLNDKGGEEEHKLIIEEMPSHTHDFLARWDRRGDGGDIFLITGWSSNGPQSIPRHNANIGNTGDGKPHNNMPPFYVLAYIMKL